MDKTGEQLFTRGRSDSLARSRTHKAKRGTREIIFGEKLFHRTVNVQIETKGPISLCVGRGEDAINRKTRGVKPENAGGAGGGIEVYLGEKEATRIEKLLRASYWEKKEKRVWNVKSRART